MTSVVLSIYTITKKILNILLCISGIIKEHTLFGAGTEIEKNSWSGTTINWEAFKHLAYKKFIKEIDLEGINSPNRGSFKLSFGGTIESYFKIIKK